MPTLQNASPASSREHWPDLSPVPQHWAVRWFATAAIIALLPFAALLVVLVNVLMRLVLWKARDT